MFLQRKILGGVWCYAPTELGCVFACCAINMPPRCGFDPVTSQVICFTAVGLFLCASVPLWLRIVPAVQECDATAAQ
jgi:hypothetical protein